MFRFEELEVWQIAVEYADQLYDVASRFPPSEVHGLTSQLKRAAVSVASNIAEGSGSGSKKKFLSFLDISIGSVMEVVSHLKIAELRGYISRRGCDELYETAEKLVRKLRSFKKSLA